MADSRRLAVGGGGRTSALLRIATALTMAIIGFSALAALPAGAAAVSQGTAGLPAGASVAPETSAQRALLSSSIPKHVVLDAQTGAIVSITTGGTLSPNIVVGQVCLNYSDACWTTTTIPEADHSFSGTGLAYGPWPDRGDAYTFAHSSAACWYNSAGAILCTSEYGPDSTLSWGGVSIVGVAWDNYT